MIVNDTFCFAFSDFAEHLQEEMMIQFIEGFGQCEFECLYVESEEDDPEYKFRMEAKAKLDALGETYKQNPSKWLNYLKDKIKKDAEEYYD